MLENRSKEITFDIGAGLVRRPKKKFKEIV